MGSHGLYGRPWEVPFEGIHVPVDVWHGDADTSAGFAAAVQVAAQPPHCTTRFLAKEGHDVMARHISEILQPLGRCPGAPRRRLIDGPPS